MRNPFTRRIRCAVRRTRAFTLAELMVVLVVLSIIGVLAGVSYSSTQGTLNNSGARAVLTMVSQSELRFSTDYGSYTSYGPDLSSLLDRGVSITNTTSAGAFQVSLALSSDGTLGAAVLDQSSSTCEVAQVAPLSAGGVTPASAGAVTFATLASGTACSGANALSSGSVVVAPASQKY